MTVQIIYNLLEQQIGRPLIPLAVRHGVGLMVRVPHSSGLLRAATPGTRPSTPTIIASSA